MKLGVNTVLFKGVDVKTAMKAIKAAGYDGVELSAIGGMCEHLVLDAWETQAPLIKAAAKEAGAETIYLSSYAGNQAANTCDYFFSASHIGFTKLPFRIENSSSVVTLCNLLITLVARFRGNSIEGGRRKRK